MGDVFLDALIDTLWVVPFLLIMNALIEVIEYKSKGLRANRILKGGIAPLIGTAVGVVPQCGFSVVATELYGKRRIALGTLLAVYIATSDEALPIMLASYDGITKILPVLIIKICFALIVGYSVFGVEKLVYARRARTAAPDSGESAASANETAHDVEAVHTHADEHDHNNHAHDDHDDEGDVHAHMHGCHHHALGGEGSGLPENATKRQKAARVWNLYLKHPLLHTATVVLYIFIVNVVFGTIVYYVGEDSLAAVLDRAGYAQPVLAAAVGLIPNCAGSVVITELYVVGGLNLGGAVAGLCVSAGVGYAVLIKQNKPVKNTVLIIALMYIVSVALGMIINALPPLTSL